MAVAKDAEVHVIHVGPTADTPTVIIVHGFGGGGPGDKRWRFRLGRYLAEHGLAAVLFESRGTGWSDGGFEEWNVSTFREDLLAVLRDLKECNSQKLGVFGYSVGSAVSVLALAEEPIADALVTLTLPIDMATNFLWYFERLMPGSLDSLYAEGEVWVDDLAEYVRRGFMDDLKAPYNDVRTAIGALKIPMLLLQPEHDTEVPMWISQQAFELKPAPKNWNLIPSGTHRFRAADGTYNSGQEEYVFAQTLEWFRQTLSS